MARMLAITNPRSVLLSLTCVNRCIRESTSTARARQETGSQTPSSHVARWRVLRSVLVTRADVVHCQSALYCTVDMDVREVRCGGVQHCAVSVLAIKHDHEARTSRMSARVVATTVTTPHRRIRPQKTQHKDPPGPHQHHRTRHGAAAGCSEPACTEKIAD